jgi:hypothetical protein
MHTTGTKNTQDSFPAAELTEERDSKCGHIH